MAPLPLLAPVGNPEVKARELRARWRLLARLTGVLCLLLAGAGLHWAKSILFVEGGSQNADVIIVLGGESADRTWRALELYKAGAAPRILVSGTGDCDLRRERLVLAGVPPAAVFRETESRNTQQNAACSSEWLRGHGAKNAIIVTSWYHSRRALACFRHLAKDIELSSYPTYHSPSMEDKPGWRDIPDVFREYLALAWYWARYGISPSEGGEVQRAKREELRAKGEAEGAVK